MIQKSYFKHLLAQVMTIIHPKIMLLVLILNKHSHKTIQVNNTNGKVVCIPKLKQRSITNNMWKCVLKSQGPNTSLTTENNATQAAKCFRKDPPWDQADRQKWKKKPIVNKVIFSEFCSMGMLSLVRL